MNTHTHTHRLSLTHTNTQHMQIHTHTHDVIQKCRVSPTILPWVMLPRAAFLTFSARSGLEYFTCSSCCARWPLLICLHTTFSLSFFFLIYTFWPGNAWPWALTTSQLRGGRPMLFWICMYVCMYPCTYVCFPNCRPRVSVWCVFLYIIHTYTHTQTHTCLYTSSVSRLQEMSQVKREKCGMGQEVGCLLQSPFTLQSFRRQLKRHLSIWLLSPFLQSVRINGFYMDGLGSLGVFETDETLKQKI